MKLYSLKYTNTEVKDLIVLHKNYKKENLHKSLCENKTVSSYFNFQFRFKTF